MQLISKLMRGVEHIGFRVSDEGLEYDIPAKYIYNEETVECLKAFGYKYYNYYYNVVTGDGTPVMDLSEMQFTGSDDDYMTLLNLSEDCLTEPEMAKYFVIDTTPIVALDRRAPKVKYSTRDEFLRYLEQFQTSRFEDLSCIDCQPLNSFVAKEALFTMDEAVNSAFEVGHYLSIISERRIFNTYHGYTNAVRFLQTEGLILKDNPSYGEFIKAYNAWGLDGFNDDIVSEGVNPMFSLKNVIEGYSGRNELCCVDKFGTLYGHSGVVKVEDVNTADFTTAVYRPGGMGLSSYVKAVRSISEDYEDVIAPLSCIEEEIVEAYEVTLRTKEGIAYKVINTIDEIYVKNAIGVQVNQFPFMRVRTPLGTSCAMSLFPSLLDYSDFVVALAKSYDLIREHTIKPAYSCSYDMLRENGLSPYAAIKYAGHSVMMNNSYYKGYVEGVDYKKAADLIKDDVKESYVSRFNPNDIPYSNWCEASAIMSGGLEDPAIAETYNPGAGVDMYEIKYRPVENLEFANRLINNKESIGEFMIGQRADAGSNAISLALLLQTAVRYYRGKVGYSMPVRDALTAIESAGVLDFTKLVNEKSNAYYGCLKDQAMLNSRRAASCIVLCAVDKVFAEISNKQAMSNRHYAVRMLTLDVSKGAAAKGVMTRFATKYKEIVETSSNLAVNQKEVAILLADFVAARTAMGIYASRGAAYVNEDGFYNIHIPIMSSASKGSSALPVEIVVPMHESDFASLSTLRHNIAYSSLCELVENEFDDATGCFPYFLMNAKLNIFNIEPKSNSRIPVYSFALNYVPDSAFDKTSDAFRQSIRDNKAKVDSIKDYYYSSKLLGESFEDNFMKEFPDAALTSLNGESIKAYYDRFIFYNNASNEAKAGNAVLTLPMRTDALFSNFASLVGCEAIESVEFFKPESAKEKMRYFSVNMPEVLSVSFEKRLETSNAIKQFDFSEAGMLIAANGIELILSISSMLEVQLLISGTTITVITAAGRKQIPIDEFRIYIDKYIEYGCVEVVGNRQYLVKTVTGLYLMEV